MQIYHSLEKNLKTANIVIASIILEAILLYLYYFPEVKQLSGDEVRYFDTAMSILNGGEWHPTPTWPPLQSIIIAGFLKLSNGSLITLQIFQYLLLLVSGFILKDIVFKATHCKLASQFGLAIMLLYPSWLAYSQYLWPEVTHVFTLISIIWINNYKSASYKWMIISGCLIGLTLLLKSLTLLFIPFFFYPLLFKHGSFFKKLLLPIIIQLSFALLVIAPTAIKSHQNFGSYMISNSAMFNLNFGIREDSRQSFVNAKGGYYYNQYMNSSSDYQSRNKIVKDEALKIIQQQGYVKTFLKQLSKQYFRLFEHSTFFSNQFKGEQAKGYKGAYHHEINELLVTILLFFDKAFYTIMILAAIMGLVYSVCKSKISQQFAIFIAYNLALFLILHAKTRFRIPLLPMIAFYNAYLIYFMSLVKTKDLSALDLLKSKPVNSTIFTLFILALVFIYLGPYLDKILPI